MEPLLGHEFVRSAGCEREFEGAPAGVMMASLGKPFRGQRRGQRVEVRTPGGLDQGQIEQVALCVAAAEPVRIAANRAQQPYRVGVPLLSEGLDRESRVQADLARERGRVAA